MALRLIEVSLPKNQREEAEKIFKEKEVIAKWSQDVDNKQVIARISLLSNKTEGLIDALSGLSESPGFQLLVFPVEATIPPLEEPDEEENPTEPKESPSRVSRQELYDDLSDTTQMNITYFLMVALSSIVCALGISNRNSAVIIGAMVITPLLGPNIALALASTLGDFKLAMKSIKVNFLGLILALVLSIFMGWMLPIDLSNQEVFLRAHVKLSSIVLALASGCAGTLAFTTGLSANLIGVMIAVALLPPLVTTGMLIGVGEFYAATRASLLTLTNLIGINLAAVVTFVFQGIHPFSYYENENAKRGTAISIAIWTTLLIALALIIFFVKEHQPFQPL